MGDVKWVGPNTQIENEIKNLKAAIQKQSPPRWFQVIGIIGAVVAAAAGIMAIYLMWST